MKQIKQIFFGRWESDFNYAKHGGKLNVNPSPCGIFTATDYLWNFNETFPHGTKTHQWEIELEMPPMTTSAHRWITQINHIEFTEQK